MGRSPLSRPAKGQACELEVCPKSRGDHSNRLPALRGIVVYPRIMLSGLLLLVLSVDAAAQNRVRWRPGSILNGLGNAIRSARSSDTAEEATPTLAEEPTPYRVQSSDRGTRAEPSPDTFERARPTDVPPPPSTPPLRPGIRAPVVPVSPAVSIEDVVTMVHRGLGESTIVRHIDRYGVKQVLTVDDLIRLHEEGVSEGIIQAMQTAELDLGPRTAPQSDTLPHQSRPRRGNFGVLPPRATGANRLTTPTRNSGASPQVAGKGDSVESGRFGPSILAPPQQSPLEPPPRPSP